MLNLKEIITEKTILEKMINNYTARINEKMYKYCGVKSMNYSDLKVQVGHSNNSAMLNALASVEDLYNKRQMFVDKLDLVQKIINNFYQKTTDRNTKIYMDRNFFGYNAIQVGLKYGLSDKQVRRICKEINRKMSEDNEN